LKPTTTMRTRPRHLRRRPASAPSNSNSSSNISNSTSSSVFSCTKGKSRYHMIVTIFVGSLMYGLIIFFFSVSLYAESSRLEQQFQEVGSPVSSDHHEASSSASSSLNSDAKLQATKTTREKETSPESATKSTDKDVIQSQSQTSSATSPTSTASRSRGSKLAIFYNIYIPPTPESFTKRALDIVQEQVDQVRESYVGTITNNNNNTKTVLYYNTIGSTALTNDTMQSICSNHSSSLQCRHLQHYDTAFEEVTLNSLYNYCLNPENGNDRVIYMHSKGSYHIDNGNNDRLRKHLTRAVTDQQCLQAVDNDDNNQTSCNYCGLKFGAFPIHMPGNFFVAQCRYIRKLTPPVEFSAAMTVVTARARQRLHNQSMVRTMFPDESWYYGTERFSNEHWSGSHPDVRPCDLSARHISYWQRKDRSNYAMEYALAPREPIESNVRDFPVPLSESVRMREYSLLPGLIFKWYALYNQVPAADSWIWSFFPDGVAWREAVEKHGNRAVQMVTEQYRPETVATGDMTLNVSTSPGYTVFYNIDIRREEKDQALVLQVVMEQMEQLGSSYAAKASLDENKTLSVFYATVGSANVLNATYMDQLCSKNNLVCRHIHHYEEGHDEITLQPMYDFCQSHPSQKVIYLHNEELLDDRPGKNRWFRSHSTAAVTSAACLRLSNESCNACGLFFSPVPVMSFPGNFFTAKCSYINQLIQPSSFEVTQSEFGAVAHQMINQERLVANLAEKDSFAFGFAEFSMQHWIGSSPSLYPCDMTSAARKLYWTKKRNTTSEFDWSMAPRSSSLDKEQIPPSESLRVREYFLLAGNIMKWYTMYNEVPSASSWVWSFFPEGDKWRQAVETYGNQSIDAMVTKYHNKQ
jgi:cytoskeletal protein RodZ